MIRQLNKGKEGFTLIEVMTAVGLLTLGAGGIMALQQATIVANQSSRQITVGTAVAQTWAERLTADAMRWNSLMTLATLGPPNTRYLGNTAPVGLGNWIIPQWAGPGAPIVSPVIESPGFDYMGNDVAFPVPAGTRLTYCTSIRLEASGSGVIGTAGQTIRADIRVWWAKRGFGAEGFMQNSCVSGPEPAGIGADIRLQKIYLSLTLRPGVRL